MKPDLQTPLAKARGLGAGRGGTDHFRFQRLTAVANIPLMGFLLWLCIALAGAPHSEVIACLGQGWVSVLLILALGSLFFHMKLGMQTIIEDYVHGFFGRVLLAGNAFFCLGSFAAAVFAVLKLAFSGA